jgi:hypothetical protein|tara:strand:+ start:4420 stop:4650 length:231 start_codon:yes stop_codon:yes gene_type:complete
MALEVMNVSKFSKTIEEIVIDKRINYMDAIVWYCETNEMEVEVAAKLVNGVIKTKLEAEAIDLNFLSIPKSPKLPI